MAIVVGAFLHLLYRASGSAADADVELADTLPWVIVVVLMLPTNRLTTAGLQKIIGLWKGRNETNNNSQ